MYYGIFWQYFIINFLFLQGITISIIIMQVIYNNIIETKNISTAHNVGAAMYLQSVVLN